AKASTLELTTTRRFAEYFGIASTRPEEIRKFLEQRLGVLPPAPATGAPPAPAPAEGSVEPPSEPLVGEDAPTPPPETAVDPPAPTP
ncbi:MAG TPA: hypothetical protein VMI55_03620, partial [Thermoplasmata archaeon]|nr:hypothetical protein [Thermoplasmata archaeon]